MQLQAPLGQEGVFAVDFNLAEMSSLLEQVVVDSKPGLWAYLVEVSGANAGKLLAVAGPGDELSLLGTKGERREAQNASNACVAASAQLLRGTSWQAGAFSNEGTETWTTIEAAISPKHPISPDYEVKATEIADHSAYEGTPGCAAYEGWTGCWCSVRRPHALAVKSGPSASASCVRAGQVSAESNLPRENHPVVISQRACF